MALRSVLALASFVFVGTAPAHGPSGHTGMRSGSSPVDTAFGRSGDPARITRTIDIGMDDRMRFTPARVEIREGETVRFRVRNTGKVMHEMVIGTFEELKAHAELMRKHPNMEHDEPYMAHVLPGRMQTIVWQFTRTGDFHFGCLVPGHFEAGMAGTIAVRKGTRP